MLLRFFSIWTSLVFAGCLLSAESWEPRDPAQQEYLAQGFDQNLESQIPLDVMLNNEKGEAVPLSTYFKDRPVIISMVYFQCPSICNILLNGMVKSMQGIELTAGKDFDVITVSIHPEETPALAAAKKQAYIHIYDRETGSDGWHWLTGDEAQIRRLADAIGFHYKWNPDSKEYAHPAGIVLATSQGVVSRYLFGSEFNKQDLRLGLMDASGGKIGSLTDKIAALCYRYNPVTGQYTLLIHRIVLVACLATVVGLVALIWFLFKSEQGKPQPTRAQTQSA